MVAVRLLIEDILACRIALSIESVLKSKDISMIGCFMNDLAKRFSPEFAV